MSCLNFSSPIEPRIFANSLGANTTPSIKAVAQVLKPNDFIYKEGDYEKQNIETRTDIQKQELFDAMGEDGALLEYEDIGTNLQKYIDDNDRTALQRAISSP